MLLFRIAAEEYCRDLTGLGAKLNGGRWNKENTPAVYAAAHRSLAILEILVHADFKTLLERRYIMVEIEIPDDKNLKETITRESLPEHWKASIIPVVTQNIGTEFLVSNTKLLLQVPSALVEEEYNYVINPLHPAMAQVKIKKTRLLQLDYRLIKKVS